MIQLNIAQHATAFPSKVKSSICGHIYNIQLNESDSKYCDNGWFVAKGDFVELDLYKEAAPTTFEGVVRAQAPNGEWYVEVVTPGDALFVYETPMIEETYNNNFKKESNYTNAPKQIVRAYELAAGDIIAISAAGFAATPEADEVVELKSMTGFTAKQLGEKEEEDGDN